MCHPAILLCGALAKLPAPSERDGGNPAALYPTPKEWNCDFGWQQIQPHRRVVNGPGRFWFMYAWQMSGAVWRNKTHKTFKYFETKIASHEYYVECGVNHVPILAMGYFNSSHGTVFEDLWLDRPYPYIARFSADGLGGGTFKVDDDNDKALLRARIKENSKRIAQTKRSRWGLEEPREGVILTELVGAKSAFPYISLSSDGTRASRTESCHVLPVVH